MSNVEATDSGKPIEPRRIVFGFFIGLVVFLALGLTEYLLIEGLDNSLLTVICIPVNAFFRVPGALVSTLVHSATGTSMSDTMIGVVGIVLWSFPFGVLGSLIATGRRKVIIPSVVGFTLFICVCMIVSTLFGLATI